jgi:nucleotide-binding universal stress UspA family protein
VHVRRVIAGVSGSAGSLQALRYAAEMARSEGAVLAPVLAWTPPGGELADRRAPCPPLRRAWTQAAWDRLWQAIDLGIGGPPADIAFSPHIGRGGAGEVLSQLAVEPGDVLVIGAGRRGAIRRLTTCAVSRYCLGHAACPVIAVPPARLALEATGLHGWRLRHRIQTGDADLHAADA